MCAITNSAFIFVGLSENRSQIPLIPPCPIFRRTHPLFICSLEKVLLKCRKLSLKFLEIDRFIQRCCNDILQFLHEAGLSKKWAIADVFGLDPELLAMLEQPVLSLLLLFPINEKVNMILFTYDEILT